MPRTLNRRQCGKRIVGGAGNLFLNWVTVVTLSPNLNQANRQAPALSSSFFQGYRKLHGRRN